VTRVTTLSGLSKTRALAQTRQASVAKTRALAWARALARKRRRKTADPCGALKETHQIKAEMSSKSSPAKAPLAAESPRTSKKSLGVESMALTPRGSGHASVEASPRGSRKELLVPGEEELASFVGTVKPPSRPGSGRASPRAADFKAAALMPNPPGSLKTLDSLKSWEVKALKELEWKLSGAAKGKVRHKK
jgi:hypothetical protein